MSNVGRVFNLGGSTKGDDGKSAYEMAKAAGYTGTESAFNAALLTLQNAPFLPTAGGTITGNLTLKGSGNYGNKLNFGDGDYVHLSEPSDDCLEIKAKKVNFVLSDTTTSKFTVNGSPFTGEQGPAGAAAGFGTINATVDANVGTPSVTVSTSGSDTAKNFTFVFKNLKGATGPQGPAGAAAGFGTINATVDANVGTPSVTVSTSGSNTAKNFTFTFKNLKGATGAPGPQGPAGSDATIPYLVGTGTATANVAGRAAALGYKTNASGAYSIALGFCTNANGDSSTALGFWANANGSSSTALGYWAKTNGAGSTALGVYANASAAGSIALGSYTNANGDSSIALGGHANASGDSSTALGYYATTSNANSIQLGDAANLSSITAKVPITVTSDERDKADITEIGYGATEFLKALKAVTFVYNQRELYRPKEPEFDENGDPIIEDGVDYLTEEDHENLAKYGYCRYDVEAHKAGSLKGTRRRVGLLAQATQKALAEVYGTSDYANIVNDNLHDFKDVPEGIESTLAMNYEALIPFLIKAFQELEARVTAQEAIIADLMARLTALEAAHA